MALKGRLRDFSLTQLLNLVHLARKTGALAVDATAGGAELYFQEGKLVYASLKAEPNTLGDVLVRAGKLTQAQVNSLVASGRARDDNQLGRLLLQTNQVSREDVIQSLQSEMKRVVYAVFGWEDGVFVFDQKLPPPTGRVLIPTPLDSIVVEGSRRREEVADLQTELPSLDVVLKFTEGTNLRNINLSVDEWRVISFINPRNTVATIAQYNEMTEFQVRQIVARLLRDHLVEVVGGTASRSAPAPSKAQAAASAPRPSGPTPVVQSAPAPPKPSFTKPEVEKNLLNRIINRIRGL